MLEKVSGDGQLGPAGELLPEPLVVHALDRLGNPAIGVPVAFQIIEGGGSPTPAQTQTDVQGRASTTWTLGALAGEAQAIRSFLSFSVGQGVNFAATAVPGLPAEIVVVSGDGVAAPRLSTLSDPLTVRVEDRLQNPVDRRARPVRGDRRRWFRATEQSEYGRGGLGHDSMDSGSAPR